MAGHSFEESKKIALKTITILAVVTVIEVIIALAGKGYLVPGFVLYEDFLIGDFNAGRSLMYLAMISLSIYKAYLVVFEFMHMRYEVRDLVKSVLLPTVLLVWAIIAFFMEGSYWHDSRARIQQQNREIIETTVKPHFQPSMEADKKSSDQESH